jgi:hypothetical protein
LIQNIHRVPIEFPKLFSGIGIGTLHFLLVINLKPKKERRLKWIKEKQNRVKTIIDIFFIKKFM